jgi:uncharacterized repeat protein (TIGR01451 family)
LLGSIALLAMALAGASSAARPHAGLVGAPTAASSKVRAIGPGFVRQVGLRNYAGPNCPGAGWNCTSSTRVVQAASPGGTNVGECTGSAPTANPCFITQAGASNIAKCTQKTGDNQACTINQTGASNTAIVSQYISQSTGATQDGTQTASIEQKPADGGTTVLNVARVTQSVSQNTKTLGAQKQNAHQKAVVTQTALGAGSNQSDVNQSQLQKAYGGSSQEQNFPGAAGADCLAGSPDQPNTCSDVTQNAVSGNNQNSLNQSIDQDAKTAVATPAAIQRQGAFTGGLEGHVHQHSDSGSSLNKAKQDKHQNVNGPANAIQTQYDPVRCCGDFSIEGAGVEDINQSSSINASSAGAEQHSTLIGESRTPDGTCTINQRAAIDTDATSNSESLTPCPLVVVTTSCSSGGIDIDAVFRGDDCTAFPPEIGEPNSVLGKTVRNGDESYDGSTTAATADIVDFQLSYSNTGNVDAHDVTLTDEVPAGLAFVDCDPEPIPCSYNSDNNTITWDVGTVAFDDGVNVFFQAEVVEDANGTTITNTADAASKEEGPGAASDSATVTVANLPASSLGLCVRNLGDEFGTCAALAVASGGSTLEYTITYSNSGTGAAHDVTVTMPMPGGTETPVLTCLVAVSCAVNFAGGVPTGITWNVGTVAAGSTVTATLQVHVLTTACEPDPAIHATVDTAEEAPITSPDATIDLPVCGPA